MYLLYTEVLFSTYVNATIFFLRAFVDQYSTSESSRSPEHARSFARVTACLSALEGILKGSSSFSPIRRYVMLLHSVSKAFIKAAADSIFHVHLQVCHFIGGCCVSRFNGA